MMAYFVDDEGNIWKDDSLDGVMICKRGRIMLIDCPYYKEYMTGRNNNSPMNCWDEDFMYDEGSTDCNVPGQRRPLCDKKKNGYKDGVFIAKVSKSKLDKALKSFQYRSSLLPENIVKRLDEIEKQLGELKK